MKRSLAIYELAVICIAIGVTHASIFSIQIRLVWTFDQMNEISLIKDYELYL
ncbi:hypothetical protein HanIR_Chr16g0825801 [Helianthus annuus]|uniref:Uncharacterized protein n=1 Tax=Helianthus annuus TaxID=4232 RepID=A0A251T756_HELAN|nr:hypothetical protein HanIR_Chr16g0825801 [Helianthus annuus]